MNENWNKVQAKAAVPGSAILTQWKADRDAQRTGGVRNTSYSESVTEAFGITPGAAGMSVTPASAMRVSAVFACVQKIAGAISTMPIDVYETDGDTPVKLPRDDLWYKLNEEPCPQFTAASHWEGTIINMLLRGDSYTWIRRSMNGDVREFLPLPWSSVTPVLQQDRSVRYYIHYQGISTWVGAEDMLHFAGFGFDGLKGMSVIAYAARNAAGNALAMDEYAGKFFQNGAHPSGILTVPGKMNEEAIGRLQTSFANKYSGIENANRIPLVLTDGLAFKEVSLNAEDSQLLESRQFQVIDIARAFGVPPHMIGETSGSTSWGTGIESMSRGFVTYTLKQHLKRIEQEKNRKLYPNRLDRFVRFDIEALTEGDSKAQAEYNRAALGGPGTGAGWMTVDEVRKTKGLPPLKGMNAQVYDPRTAAPAAAPDTTQGNP